MPPTDAGPDVDALTAAAHLLDSLPASVFVIDGVGTIRSATASAAALVELDAPALGGRSVLDFVDAETAWAYATTVAMATDYPDVITGPMRVTVVSATGARRMVDLWATNRLEDPDVEGIVCLVTEQTAATGIAEAVSSFAAGDETVTVAMHVADAMRGHPVVADAFVVVPEADGFACVGGTDLAADLVHVVDDDAAGAEPWRAAINGTTRVIHDDLGRLPAALHEAAVREGYAALWVEPVIGPSDRAEAALVLWRRRRGVPSPNQLRSMHQAAAVLGIALRARGITGA